MTELSADPSRHRPRRPAVRAPARPRARALHPRAAAGAVCPGLHVRAPARVPREGGGRAARAVGCGRLTPSPASPVLSRRRRTHDRSHTKTEEDRRREERSTDCAASRDAAVCLAFRDRETCVRSCARAPRQHCCARMRSFAHAPSRNMTGRRYPSAFLPHPSRARPAHLGAVPLSVVL